MRRVMCSNLSAVPACVNTIPSKKRKDFRRKSGEAAFPQAGKREVGAKIFQKSRATAAGRTVSRPFRHCFATVLRPFRHFPPAACVTLLSRCGSIARGCGCCHASVTRLSRCCHAGRTVATVCGSARAAAWHERARRGRLPLCHACVTLNDWPNGCRRPAADANSKTGCHASPATSRRTRRPRLLSSVESRADASGERLERLARHGRKPDRLDAAVASLPHYAAATHHNRTTTHHTAAANARSDARR